MKQSKKRWLCVGIIGVILIGTAFAAGWQHWRRQHSDVGVAEVSVDGEVLYTYDLQQVRTSPERIVIGETGAENVLEIGTGYIMVEYASCPDQVCVRMGKISKPGETIVCLPHKLIVTIREGGSGDGDEIDAQT